MEGLSGLMLVGRVMTRDLRSRGRMEDAIQFATAYSSAIIGLLYAEGEEEVARVCHNITDWLHWASERLGQ